MKRVLYKGLPRLLDHCMCHIQLGSLPKLKLHSEFPQSSLNHRAREGIILHITKNTACN